MTEKLYGLVLSGGKSSRMGTDKGLMNLNGKPLIQYAIDFLKQFTDTILISTNNKAYDQFGYRLIHDQVQDIGPMGGIYSALKLSKPNHFFIVACDMTKFSFEIAAELIALKHKYDVVVPRLPGNRIEPLFGIYSKKIVHTIEQQIDKRNYKLTDLLGMTKTYYVDISEKQLIQQPFLFHNMNTPDDLKYESR